jgi:ATP-binding cassette subfamily F protein uup
MPKKQYDYVEKLSGGELKRLFMYCLIQNQTLILDEPTNDLDCNFKCTWKLLLDYPGCLLTVYMTVTVG